MKEITSASNERFKRIKSLKTKAARKELGLMLAEGERTVRDLPDEVAIRTLVFAASQADKFAPLAKSKGVDDVLIVPDKLFDSLSDTVTPSGALAVVVIPPPPAVTAADCVVLDGISDPGNFGTIIRTCAACGVEQIVAVGWTDPTSPKVVRASMGCVFRTRVVECNADEAATALAGHDVYALDMGGENIFAFKRPDDKPFALVVGSEAHGVSPLFRARADKTLSLPMTNGVESLNAAIAASVALYQLVCRK